MRLFIYCITEEDLEGINTNLEDGDKDGRLDNWNVTEKAHIARSSITEESELPGEKNICSQWQVQTWKDVLEKDMEEVRRFMQDTMEKTDSSSLT